MSEIVSLVCFLYGFILFLNWCVIKVSFYKKYLYFWESAFFVLFKYITAIFLSYRHLVVTLGESNDVDSNYKVSYLHSVLVFLIFWFSILFWCFLLQAVPSFLRLLNLHSIAQELLSHNTSVEVISLGGEPCLTGNTLRFNERTLTSSSCCVVLEALNCWRFSEIFYFLNLSRHQSFPLLAIV